jgi:hypothetical protein
MKKLFIAIVLFACVSLHSNGQDFPTVANEYCGCFEKLKDSVDVKFQEVLDRVVKQANIKTAFQTELQAMSSADRVKLGQQLEYIGKTMESGDNAAGKCGLTLDEKYKKYNDTPAKEKDFNAKMIAELEKKADCKFLLSLTKFALAFEEQ